MVPHGVGDFAQHRFMSIIMAFISAYLNTLEYLLEDIDSQDVFRIFKIYPFEITAHLQGDNELTGQPWLSASWLTMVHWAYVAIWNETRRVIALGNNYKIYHFDRGFHMISTNMWHTEFTPMANFIIGKSISAHFMTFMTYLISHALVFARLCFFCGFVSRLIDSCDTNNHIIRFSQLRWNSPERYRLNRPIIPSYKHALCAEF